MPLGSKGTQSVSRVAGSLRRRTSERGEARVSTHFISWRCDANHRIGDGWSGTIGPIGPS